MYEWILPSLSEILAQNQSSVAECSPGKAERQWRVSLAATEHLLLNTLAANPVDTIQGLVLAAPAPLFSQPKLTQNLQTVTFTAKPFNPLALMPFQMPDVIAPIDEEIAPHESVLPLLPADPLGTEQFCLVFTDKFRLVLVLATHKNGKKTFSFSFEPEVVEQAWRSLGARVMLANPEFFARLDVLVQQYSPVAPDCRIMIQFSQLLLQELTEAEETGEEAGEQGAGSRGKNTNSQFPIPNPQSPNPDVELLQAFAHEVRTPLTTIRTMTRLLLKRRDLDASVINRLKIIDHECTEQIDRMELLFKAAELETTASTKCPKTQLTPMSLDQVLQQSIPRWEQAAHRRNLTLNVVLPQQLPTVVSNPMMLDQVLTGLIENFTRSLPSGSHIQVQVIPAGDQLKLQLSPQFGCKDSSKAATPATPPIRKALGQLLMFQPETGTISLNIAATKHLFQAIGGKLIVRQRPHYGEVLTIFLPLEVSNKHKSGAKTWE
ncbi:MULTISPECIES: HAMP domain-containing sensor histidine kinase [unclassified Nostoc]|uniref:sensor histidine kinase n=1 Tax=unclassified Nostoc TaxID=2593658 RepID=UPI000DEC99B6|nr:MULTISPECIES: HAMP domain-containing sensor histidine kinase [unclassified Nostoc]MBD2506902.1 HAMP domain-containing histidine kinase [Desmonostoc muscorum FACHB-395]QHG19034.1 sensor histidine kinase [Nostoc sp. ATCC 53789]QLE47395.1 HAMP domain-containing histidine kinase [Nostoc sp. C057]RCJ18851.1 histidine kinase [Nostoc sp. ATCC 53789]